MPKFIAFAGLVAVLVALVVAAVYHFKLPVIIAHVAIGLAALIIAVRAIYEALQHFRGGDSPAADPVKDARVAAKREARRRRKLLLGRLDAVVAILKAAQAPSRPWYRERGGAPWWLVVGPAGHGKTELLRAAPDARELAPPTEADEPRFFLAAGAVFLELPASSPPTDGPALAALLAGIRRLRPQRPLAGILVVHRADALLDPVALDLGATRRTIDRVAATLAIQVPVILVVSQLDRLAGHAELLEGLHPLQQPLGVVLPLREGKNSVFAAATASLDAPDGVVEWVRQRCHALVARTAPGAPRQPRLYGLWQQFARLTTATATAAAQLAQGPLPGGDPLRMRGIFFVSARPDPFAPEDHWAAMLAQRVSGQLLSDPPPNPTVAPAFVRGLFTSEVVQAGLYATRSDRYLRRRFFATALAALGLATAAGFTIHGSTHAARANEVLLQATLDSAVSVQGTADEQFAPLVHLDRLREAVATWRAPEAPSGAGWGLFHGDELGERVTDTYLRAVCSGVLRPLATRTHRSLRQFASRHAGAGQASSDAAREAFDALRAYLLLSAPADASEPQPWQDEQSPWLSTHIETAWSRASADSDDRRAAVLADHVALLSFAQPAPDAQDPCTRTGHTRAIDRDLELIAAVREILNRTPPDRDHVARLVEQIDRRSDLTAVSVRGLTTAHYLRSDVVVTPAFTRTGWRAFQAVLTTELDSGGEQTWVLGHKQATETRLTRCTNLRTVYTGLYTKSWDRFIRSLQLDSPGDLDAAAAIFRELAEDMPLTAIFKAVVDHTQNLGPLSCTGGKAQPTIVESVLRRATGQPTTTSAAPTSDAAQVAAMFVKFTAFGAPPVKTNADTGGAVMLDSYHKRLAEVRSAIDKARDNNAELPALAAAVTDGLTDVTSMIQRGPFGAWKEPLQQLLSPPFVGLDIIIGEAGMEKLHAEWCSTVHASLQRSVVGRYPFAANAREDARLADLEALFHPQNGEIAKFRGTWLGAYVSVRGNDIEAGKLGVGARYHLSSRAVDFFDAAHKLGLLLHASGPASLDLGLQLRCEASVQRVVLKVDGVETDYDCSIDQAKQVHWPGKDGERGARLIAHGNGRVEEVPGDGEFGLLRLFEGAQPTLRPRQSAFDIVFALPRRDLGKLRATVHPRDLRGGNLFFGFGGARFLAPLRAAGFVDPPHALFAEFSRTCPTQP